MPIHDRQADRLLRDDQRRDRAADRQRQREQDGDRLQEAAEQQHQHGVDHHDARAHRLGEALEHLLHDLGVAELLQLDAGGKRLRRGKTLHRRDRLAERRGADANPPPSERAVPGRSGRWWWGPGPSRSWATEASGTLAPPDVVTLNARNRFMIARASSSNCTRIGTCRSPASNFGSVGGHVADGGNPHGLRNRLGRNAELCGQIGLRHDAQFRPLELGGGDWLSEQIGRLAHLRGNVGCRVVHCCAIAPDDHQSGPAFVRSPEGTSSGYRAPPRSDPCRSPP